MMDNLAINSMLPADTTATQAADADAMPEDGKTFLDALSGLMSNRSGKENTQDAEDTDITVDGQIVQASESVDPAAGIPLVLPAFDPAVASKPADRISAEAMIGSISISTNGLQDKAVAAELAVDSERPVSNTGVVQENAMDSRPTFAERSSALAHANANTSAILQPQPDSRQISQSSTAKTQSALQELITSDRQSSRESGTQTLAAQNTSLQGMASQFNAAFQVASSQPTVTDIPSANLIGPRVGASGWSEAMGQKIVMMASEHVQQAEIRLNPEGLGPMHVVLSLEKGAADVQFLAHDAQVREALQAALPKLQEMLTSAGFSLDRVSIDSGAAKDQGGRGNTEQFQQQRRESSRGDAEMASMPVTRVAVQNRPGRIDTFA